MPILGYRRILKFWFPVLFYSGIIFYVSSLPSVTLPVGGPTDKIVHIIEYAILGFLTARAIRGSSDSWSRRKIFLTAVVFSFAYGLSDEFHQMFVAGRTSSLADAFADGIGGWLGCFINLKNRLSHKK